MIEAGGTLAGGHSIADADVKYGLSVMGIVNPKQIYANDKGRPSDVLIFTKKLGVGWCAMQTVSDRHQRSHGRSDCFNDHAQ